MRCAFTMVEMLVVLLLVGVVASYILPRLNRRSPAVEWSTILRDLDNVIFFTRQEAIANQKVYRLAFKSNRNAPDEVRIEEEKDDPEKIGRKIYAPVSSYYFKTTYFFDPAIKLAAVYQDKQEMLAEQKGWAYCYVISDGLVQEILVQLVRKLSNQESKCWYKMNPFFGKFELYEGAAKPT